MATVSYSPSKPPLPEDLSFRRVPGDYYRKNMNRERNGRRESIEEKLKRTLFNLEEIKQSLHAEPLRRNIEDIYSMSSKEGKLLEMNRNQQIKLFRTW